MSSSNEGSVWAVIVTFNSARWIRRCIDRLRAGTLPPQIVVVDNCSNDETASILRCEYPEVELLQSVANRGFGQACNVGIRHACDCGAEFIVQMNDDACVTRSALQTLVDVAINHADFGMLIPTNTTNDREHIDEIFLSQLKEHLPTTYLEDALLQRVKDVYEVAVLPGAVLMVKSEALDELGGFDPLFFVLGAEYDFCLRSLVSKWRVGFVPGAVVQHEYRSRASNWPASSLRSQINDVHSTFLYRLKMLDRPFALKFLGTGVFAAREFLVAFAQGNFRLALAIVISLPKMLFALPVVWKHRRRCLTEQGVFLRDLNIQKMTVTQPEQPHRIMEKEEIA